MKWLSKACIVLAILVAALLVRSTFVHEELNLWWKRETLFARSSNGQMEVALSSTTVPIATNPKPYPTGNFQHFPIVTGGLAKVGFALGDGFGDHDYQSGPRGWSLFLSFPHWSLVLLLLALPTGRWVVRRVRGPVESPRQRGFAVT